MFLFGFYSRVEIRFALGLRTSETSPSLVGCGLAIRSFDKAKLRNERGSAKRLLPGTATERNHENEGACLLSLARLSMGAHV